MGLYRVVWGCMRLHRVTQGYLHHCHIMQLSGAVDLELPWCG